MSNPIRIGSRRSDLAMWQSRHVGSLLEAGGHKFEIVQVVTQGDRIVDRPLPEIGAKGLFTKELEDMLLDGSIDIAVHSLKDLPGELPDGLTLGAVSKREDPRDALVARGVSTFADLPPGARVGTGSIRRSAQLLHLRSDIEILPIRGNVPTRIDKMHKGDYDAIVLAAAGVRRLGLDKHVTEYFPFESMIPAPGQGALGIECRAADDTTIGILDKLIADPDAALCCAAERVVGGRLDAGCNAPIGVHATVDGDRINVVAFVSDATGEKLLRAQNDGARDDYATVANALADSLERSGAADLIRSVRDGSGA